MEESTLKFNHLLIAINDFLNDFIEIYKSILTKDNKKASGNLISSIRNYNVVLDGEFLKGEISLANYWKYVEYGRKRGKFPPPQAILNWVELKQLPRPISGLKTPTKEQFAYLVGRKIAREGIQPGNQFQEALNIAWNKWERPISEAASKDISDSIDSILSV